MSEPNMEAASAEFQKLTQDTTQEVEQLQQTEPSGLGQDQAQQEATAKKIANFFEGKLGDKIQQLPYEMQIALKHNGQVMDVPLEKMANAYRQVEHLQSKQKEFLTKEQTYQQKLQEAQEAMQFRSKYGALQEWSEQNPEAFERLWSLYESKDQLLGQAQGNEALSPLMAEMTQLKSKLSQIEPEFMSWKQAREQEAEQKDVQLVQTQMDDISKEYPFIDLGEKDLDGIDLRSRIIQHGLDNGFRDFETAFFTYPGLRQRLSQGIRESVMSEKAKQIKTDSRNGIIARGSTPSTVKPSEPVNVKRLSPNERDSMALSDLERMLGG